MAVCLRFCHLRVCHRSRNRRPQTTNLNLCHQTLITQLSYSIEMLRLLHQNDPAVKKSSWFVIVFNLKYEKFLATECTSYVHSTLARKCKQLSGVSKSFVDTHFSCKLQRLNQFSSEVKNARTFLSLNILAAVSVHSIFSVQFL